MQGFLDRFEGNLAVILVEEHKTEFTVAKELLPATSDVGTVFNLSIEANDYVIKDINTKETTTRKENATLLLDKLQSKKKKSKFKRS